MLGDRLRQLRLAKGLSLRALADRAGGVTAQAISNYETGKYGPGSNVLLRLAGALGVTTEYFCRDVCVEIGNPSYRSTLSDTDKRELECYVIDMLERYLEVENIFGPDTFPAFSCPTGIQRTIQEIEDAEKHAMALRTAWELGTKPIESVTELLEEHGVRVMYLQAPVEFDGCAFRQVRVVMVNKARTGDRIRFDLAHELAHLVLEFPEAFDDVSRERSAHRFAGAFLAPKEAVIRELGERRANISDAELYDLKWKYGLSMQAWIYRARDCGIISQRTLGRLFAHFSRCGWRKAEPGKQYPSDQERSTRFERLVHQAWSDGIISESKAAELLGMPVDAYFTFLISQDSAERNADERIPVIA